MGPDKGVQYKPFILTPTVCLRPGVRLVTINSRLSLLMLQAQTIFDVFPKMTCIRVKL